MLLFQEACLVDRGLETDAGHDILQNAPLRRVIKNVTGRDGRYRGLLSDTRNVAQPCRVIGPKAPGHPAIRTVAEGRFQPGEVFAQRLVRIFGDENGDQAFAPFLHVLDGERALALAGAALSDGQQPAQASIGGAIGRIDQQRWKIFKIEAAADDQAHPGRFCGFMRAHDASQRIAVRDRERGYPKPGSRREQLFGARYAAQE